jgi:hypothetical protein
MNLSIERYKTLVGICKELVKDELEKTNPKLSAKLYGIFTLIEDFEPTTNELTLSKMEYLGTTRVFETTILKPVQAVRELFNQFPEQEFSPPKIRDYLKKLKTKGELDHKGKSLLVTTHTAIRGLLKQREIIAIERKGQDPVYRLFDDSSGLPLTK